MYVLGRAFFSVFLSLFLFLSIRWRVKLELRCVRFFVDSSGWVLGELQVYAVGCANQLLQSTNENGQTMESLLYFFPRYPTPRPSAIHVH